MKIVLFLVNILFCHSFINSAYLSFNRYCKLYYKKRVFYPFLKSDLDNWNCFKNQIDNVIYNHSIVKNNNYTNYFKKGMMKKEELKHFTIQFSVFSNYFLKSQLLKVLNSKSLEEMRESKEILLNELGVKFTKNKNNIQTIEGGIYRHKFSHFEWLLDVGNSLDLNYTDLGKYELANNETKYFLNTLDNLYGSSDELVSIAASYAIENWAAAGFWDELTEGFKLYNKLNKIQIPLSFWVFHSNLEQTHADHTHDELEMIYYSGKIKDEEKFILIVIEMLDSLEIFWNGMF